MTNFTSKQKEIVARKLGYDGPMQGFDEFIASSPALEARYNAVTQKYVERMAKGGQVVKKYADGGAVTDIDAQVKQYADSLGTWKWVWNGYNSTQEWAVFQNKTTGQEQTAGTSAKGDKSAIRDAAMPILNSLNDAIKKQVDAKRQELQDAANIQKEGGVINPNTGTTPTPTDGASGDGASTGYPTTDFGVPIAPEAPQFVAAKIGEPTADQLVSTTDSMADATAEQADASKIESAITADEPAAIDTKTYDAATATDTVKGAMSDVEEAQGTVSDKAQMAAAEGTVSDKSLATTSKVGEEYIQEVDAKQRTTGADELVTAATAENAPTVGVAQTGAPAAIEAAQGTVQQNELAQAAQIKEEDMAQAEAITAEGLAPDAVAVAARLEKFTVDAGTLAEAAQGNVDAQSTVQGQLTELMKSFDDGKTPAWAAGAIRAANAAMASRGLGGSSMAGAAIFQAAMESALPIATQDAQTFANMGMQNLNNRQQVALANAAAQQGLALQNLNNEQQAALQNSANAFALQSQNLSNMQQTMIANAQIKSALQGQNLSNQQQANMAQAARYAEMANMNLNNIQQARLQDSINAVNVDLANLNNRQQSYVVQAQLDAALQGKNLDNQQQAAVLNAARYAENANITFNAEQQAQIHNSTLMQTIGLAELSNQQAVTLANAATYAAMDMANLDNRQKALAQNAQAFLQMDMANLSNEQQTTLFKAQQISQAILSDTAADNAAKQFNASSENQTEQFMAGLSSQVSQFNAAQNNAVAQFNVDQANAVAKFNAEQQNARDEFNSKQRLVIDQSNAQWRRDISTADTAATNAANYLNAQNMQQLTLAEYNNEVQMYRDYFEMAWSSYEKQADRANSILTAEITRQGGIAQAEANAEGDLWSAALSFGTKVAGDWVKSKLFG